MNAAAAVAIANYSATNSLAISHTEIINKQARRGEERYAGQAYIAVSGRHRHRHSPHTL